MQKVLCAIHQIGIQLHIEIIKMIAIMIRMVMYSTKFV